MLKKLVFVSVLALLACEQPKKAPVQVKETITIENVSVNLISPKDAVPVDLDAPALQKAQNELSEMTHDMLSVVGLYYFNPEPSCYQTGTGRGSYRKCHPGLIEKVCSIESVNVVNRFFAELPLAERTMVSHQFISQTKSEIQHNMMPQMLEMKILHEGEDYVVISKGYKQIRSKPEISAKVVLNGFLFNLGCVDKSVIPNHNAEWEKMQTINWVNDLIHANANESTKEISTETK